MNIELRNVHFSERFSEETNCFDAMIYIDGKRACSVRNDGHGGPDYFDDHAVEKRLNEYAETLPEFEAFGMTLTHNAETLVGGAFEQWLDRREVKKHMTKGLVFETLEGKYAATKSLTPELRARVLASPAASLAKLKATRFVVDFDQALALYQSEKNKQTATA